MRRISERDLHLTTRKVLREVSEGHVYVVENRGVPVAELRAYQPRPPTRRLPNRGQFFQQFPKVHTDSGRMLEDDRG